ncbi:MAG: C2 family cysteine protease [Prochloraceae cyanobacterium]|nr:C2 family cysteine protease [Prochloraceae cyanobacterium]
MTLSSQKNELYSNANTFDTSALASGLLPSNSVSPLELGASLRASSAPGSTGATYDLGTLPRTPIQRNNEFVTPRDPTDVFKFRITGTRNINLNLHDIRWGDADLRLYRDSNSNGILDANDRQLAKSRRGSNKDDFINYRAGTGTYFAKVERFRSWSSSGNVYYDLHLSATPTRQASNLLPNETNVGILSNTRIFNKSIGNTNTADVYRFSLNSIRNVSLSLTGLSRDVDFRLIQDTNNNRIVDSGEVIASSIHGGNWNEAINKNLGSGNYFVQVYQYSGNTNYWLKMATSTPVVTVSINRVRALDSVDSFGSSADFYTKIRIGNSTWQSGNISNDNDISPYWTYSRNVTSRYVPISIQIWDKDGWLNPDDHIDINRRAGVRGLYLTYDLLTDRISGDISGTGGHIMYSRGYQNDRAQMWFRVAGGDWYNRYLQDLKIGEWARSCAADGQLSRNDMMKILRQSKDGNVIDFIELRDLRKLVSDRRGMMTKGSSGYVYQLTNKVVNFHPANAWWTGGAANRTSLGNLVAGASADRLEKLIRKWFLGEDLPLAYRYNSSARDGRTPYTYLSVRGSLFRNGPNPQDINQGDLGDCYFLAALAGTARRVPSWIQNMFIPNGDNTWTVRFFRPRVGYEYITVNRWLPTNSNGQAVGRAVYAGWGGGLSNNRNNELWVALLEKAYAQMNESGWLGQDNENSYQKFDPNYKKQKNHNYTGINNGDPLSALRHITALSTSGSKTSNLSDFNSVVNAFNNGHILTFTWGGHVYTPINYNSTTRRFQVYNPWGPSFTRWMTWNQIVAQKSTWGYAYMM